MSSLLRRPNPCRADQQITGAARGPEDTTDQAGAAIIYVQNVTNHARTKLAVQIEKDFLISTMFDAMDMHLVTLTRVSEDCLALSWMLDKC